MLKTLKSQAGVVDVMLVALLLVGVIAIGGAVYYVQAQAKTGIPGKADFLPTFHKKKPQNYLPADHPGTDQPNTANWTSFSSKTGQFSLKYNSAWKSTICSNDSSIYLAPSAAALGACNSGFSGQMSVVSTEGSGSSQSDWSKNPNYVNVTKEAVVVDGKNGSRESATVKSANGPGPAVGSKLVRYTFTTGGRSYFASYAQDPTNATKTDVLADFDAMIKTTLRFSS